MGAFATLRVCTTRNVYHRPAYCKSQRLRVKVSRYTVRLTRCCCKEAGGPATIMMNKMNSDRAHVGIHSYALFGCRRFTEVQTELPEGRYIGTVVSGTVSVTVASMRAAPGHIVVITSRLSCAC